MRKLYLFTDHLAAGGIGVVIEKQAILLSRAGYDVQMFCNIYGAVPFSEWDVLSPGLSKRLMAAGVSIRAVVPSEIGAIISSLEARDTVIVHASWRGRAIARGDCFRNHKGKVVYFLHSSCEQDEVIMNFDLLRNLCTASSIVTASDLVSRDLRSVSKDVRISLLTYGVDAHVFSPRRVKKMEEKSRRVLFIGRPNKVKGGHLLPAIAELLASHNIKMVVHGVFRKGDYAYQEVSNIDRTESAIKETDVARLMQNSASLIVPSTKGEGQPLVVLEAMACGTLVIATEGAVGGLWSDHPVIVASADAISLSDALVRAFKDPIGTQRRVETGLQQVTQFTWKKHVEEFSRFLG